MNYFDYFNPPPGYSFTMYKSSNLFKAQGKQEAIK